MYAFDIHCNGFFPVILFFYFGNVSLSFAGGDCQTFLGTDDDIWSQQVFRERISLFLFLHSCPPQQFSIYGRPGLLLLFGFSRVWNPTLYTQATKTAHSCGSRVDDAFTDDNL